MGKNDNILNFDDGVEELKINGDERRILRFNPTSKSLLDNIEKANNEIGDYMKELDKDANLQNEDKFEKLDKFVKEKIDGIFGNGSSQIIFGSNYSIATVKGNYIYENFLIAVMEYMTAKLKAETELSKKRVEEYTKKAEELKK